jgi:hypothetical protein
MKEIYKLRIKWKEKMRVFLGLYPNYGKETVITETKNNEVIREVFIGK